MPDITVMLKAMAEETRLRILRLISKQELAVNELTDTLGTTQSRISRHLAILRRAGLVRTRREGNWIYYRVDEAHLSASAKALWAPVRSQVEQAGFFPEDFERLKDTLARREARTKAYFDVVLTEWDRIRRSYIDDHLSFAVVSSLVRPKAVVVDVGTGTGEMLLPLARTAAQVIGIDRSEKMLDVCRQRLARAGLTNVELRLGEAEALPLADGQCDTAFSSMLLHHLGDPAQGVREMARIVRPGGRIVISDLTKHHYDWTREVMADVWLGFTEEQIRQWLAAAGLADVTYSSTELPSPIKAESRPKLRAFLATGAKPRH